MGIHISTRYPPNNLRFRFNLGSGFGGGAIPTVLEYANVARNFYHILYSHLFLLFIFPAVYCFPIPPL